MFRRRWPEVRAGLIGLAILLGLVEGCPLPPAQYVRPWQAPFVDIVRPVQQTVLTPVRWIPRHLRFSQRWALFQVAERDAHRLEIQGRVLGGPWQPLFRAGDPSHAAYAELLEQERVRGVWDPTDRTMYQYHAFARWLTQRVLDDRPDLQAVRLRFEKIVIDDGTVRGTGVHVYPFGRERGTR
ncbi:MAG: hypothetical protein H0T42_06830 [Deltaproteobacteria bacterium]|nr:hypothetical protein [Deltaproteobacteria bacterium]